jgi:hypothetical protein
MDKTYLELLAENDAEARKDFEPNAKDLLTADYVEYDEPVGGHDAYPDELEDQHEFQKPQGSHQVAALLPEQPKDIHKTTTNVTYDKAVQVHVISIDSRFRTDQGSNPSNFLFKLLSPIKNVISVRLSSLEIPNTWYTFSDIRGNTRMIVTIPSPTPLVQSIVITEGNYTVNSLATNDILIELFTQLNKTFPNNSFAVYFSSISGKLTISCFENKNPPTDIVTGVKAYTYLNQPKPMPTPRPSPLTGYENPVPFSMNFADGIYSTRDDNWGLGYNLGYRVQETDVETYHTGESIVDVIDSNYVFLSLNPDWRVVEYNLPDSSQTAAFAKIIVDVAKNEIVYDDGGNTVTKKYYLKQPTNISTFNIEITDEYDQYVQLEGGNVSLTLEVTEVLHSSLYEAMRT